MDCTYDTMSHIKFYIMLVTESSMDRKKTNFLGGGGGLASLAGTLLAHHATFPPQLLGGGDIHIVSNPFVIFYWKIWPGNSDAQTVVENIFPSPISARFVRVFPVSYNYEICMRMELYGCRNGKYFSFLQNLGLPVIVSLIDVIILIILFYGGVRYP